MRHCRANSLHRAQLPPGLSSHFCEGAQAMLTPVLLAETFCRAVEGQKALSKDWQLACVVSVQPRRHRPQTPNRAAALQLPLPFSHHGGTCKRRGGRREELLSRCGDICVACRHSPRLRAGDCESHAPCCTKQHRARSERAPAAVMRDMCPIRACLVLVWSVMRVQGARMNEHTSKPKTRQYKPITSERQLYTVRFDGRKTSTMHETAKISRPSSSLGPVQKVCLPTSCRAYAS